MRKQLATRIAIQHHHLRPTVELQLVKRIAFAKGHAVDIKILWPDPFRAGGNIDVVGTQTQAFRHRGRRRTHPRLLLNGQQIVIFQRLLIAGVVIAKIFTGINIDRVGANRANIRQHHLLRRIADHHDRHHRRDANNDAEHGQQRAHFIRRHRPPGHHQRFTKTAGKLAPCGRLFTAQRPGYPAAGQTFRRRVTHNFPIVDLNDPLGLCRHLRIMSDDNHGMPLRFQLMQDSHDLFTRAAVQGAGRLIGQNHLPAVHQRAGDTDPLLLAAGELRRLIFRPLSQTKPYQQIMRPGQALSSLGPGIHRRDFNVLRCRQVRKQMVTLENKTKMFPSQAGQRITAE